MITIMDSINGCFELLGAGFITISIHKLHIDKEVKGFSVIHLGFFTTWGLWNMVFFPSQGLWMSFIGGIGVVTANMIYLAQIIYYSRKNR